MKARAVAAMLLLGGCVSVGDVKAKEALLSEASAKNVSQLSACVVTALQNGAGVLVSSVPIEGGLSVVQSASLMGQMTPFVIADVLTDGDGSRVTVRVNGRRPKDAKKNFKPIYECL